LPERTRVRLAACALAAAVAGCASVAPEPEETPASRDDVAAALYHQLELVLDREAVLEREGDEAAGQERAELLRLAAEIAVRIVRIDPQADIKDLVERVERAR